MTEDLDKFARELQRLTLHVNIPTATTIALGARVVELLERVAGLKREAAIRTTTIVRLREEAEKLTKECADAHVTQETMEDVIAEGQKSAARAEELSSEVAQLREARDRLAKSDGLVTMEVELKGGSRVVGHGVVVLPDQGGEVESDEQ